LVGCFLGQYFRSRQQQQFSFRFLIFFAMLQVFDCCGDSYDGVLFCDEAGCSDADSFGYLLEDVLGCKLLVIFFNP
jgi:uncharacterized protein YqgC (DUF456 family)